MEKFKAESHTERFPDAEGGHLSATERDSLKAVLSLVVEQDAAAKASIE
tara:strand:- start:652 stop:798 length:147 start_codon:yes stop_codon:yes gene_type:complete